MDHAPTRSGSTLRVPIPGTCAVPDSRFEAPFLPQMASQLAPNPFVGVAQTTQRFDSVRIGGVLAPN